MKTPMIEHGFLTDSTRQKPEIQNQNRLLKTLNQKIDNTGQKDLDTPIGNNKENCDEIILGIREKITRFVLSKVDHELNKLQELSVNCQQQHNSNSPNDNNNQVGDDGSYHNAPPYYHTQHNTTEVPTPQYSCSNKTTNSPFHRTTNSSYGFQAGDSGAYHKSGLNTNMNTTINTDHNQHIATTKQWDTMRLTNGESWAMVELTTTSLPPSKRVDKLISMRVLISYTKIILRTSKNSQK